MGTNEAVLTSTHNLCFRSKVRKNLMPLQTPVSLHKKGCGFRGYKVVFISRTPCFPGVSSLLIMMNDTFILINAYIAFREGLH